MESFILPGTASIFIPISGTDQECKTSPEVTNAFKGTPIGNTRGLFTSKSRLLPKLKELSAMGILSKFTLRRIRSRSFKATDG
jgi:hypothetical protein